jgi:hypothetical protein
MRHRPESVVSRRATEPPSHAIGTTVKAEPPIGYEDLTVRPRPGPTRAGDGHLVRNETSQPAQDISVITAPVEGAFRTELPAPNPNCGF